MFYWQSYWDVSYDWAEFLSDISLFLFILGAFLLTISILEEIEINNINKNDELEVNQH